MSFTIKKKSSDLIMSVRLWSFLKLTELGENWALNFFLLLKIDFSFKILNEKSIFNSRKKLSAQFSPNSVNFKKLHSLTDIIKSLDFFFIVKLMICSFVFKYEINNREVVGAPNRRFGFFVIKFLEALYAPI